MGFHKVQYWKPKLFLLYLNNICAVSKMLKFVMFADDTFFFFFFFVVVQGRT